jgi:CBS domain-containing protein
VNVQDVMTKNADSCSPTTTLAAAACKMAAGDFGFLPVVDADRNVMGVLTDRDVCLAISPRTSDPARVGVRDVMRAGAHACRETDDVRTALATMREYRVRRLPVLDAAGRLTGVVSIDDLIRLAAEQPGGVTCEALVDAFRAICEHRLAVTSKA